VILGLPLEVVPALRCSLIRLDERRQPLLAVHRGSLDAAAFDAWATHLSGAENRAPCENCLASRVADSAPCPLATSLPTAEAVSHVHCLALARGGRAYGSLNIYLHDASHPDSREEALLGAMANGISWALESQHLRLRELAALYHFQQARWLTDLHDTLAEGVANVSDGGTLDADTGQVSWELGDVGPGVEASLAYDVTLTPRFPPGTTSVNHQVTITSEEGTSPASDRQAFTVTVQPKMTALLERVVVDLNDNGAVDPGDTTRYRVTYANQRDVDASGVKIVADYDETLVESVIKIGDGGTNDGSQITWQLDAVGPGAETSLTYDAQLKHNFPDASTVIEHRATIDSNELDPVTSVASLQRNVVPVVEVSGEETAAGGIFATQPIIPSVLIGVLAFGATVVLTYVGAIANFDFSKKDEKNERVDSTGLVEEQGRVERSRISLVREGTFLIFIIASILVLAISRGVEPDGAISILSAIVGYVFGRPSSSS